MPSPNNHTPPPLIADAAVRVALLFPATRANVAAPTAPAETRPTGTADTDGSGGLTRPSAPPGTATVDRDLCERADLTEAAAPSVGPDTAEAPEAELDPDSAPEPVVSADATPWIDAIAAPTPNATAIA